MKKSVLLPYERYEYLLSQASKQKDIDFQRSKHLSKNNEDSEYKSDVPSGYDADIIRSCFPLNQQEQVNSFLSFFTKSPSAIGLSNDGELTIEGHTVKGFHVTDVINRMLPTYGVEDLDKLVTNGPRQCEENLEWNADNHVTNPLEEWRPLRK